MSKKTSTIIKQNLKICSIQIILTNNYKFSLKFSNSIEFILHHFEHLEIFFNFSPILYIYNQLTQYFQCTFNVIYYGGFFKCFYLTLEIFK